MLANITWDIGALWGRLQQFHQYLKRTQTVLSRQSGPYSACRFWDNRYQISIRVQLKRCDDETRLIIPGQEQPLAHDRTIRAIQDALKKAMNWNQALVTGKAVSKAALAKYEGISPRQIARSSTSPIWHQISWTPSSRAIFRQRSHSKD